MKILSKEWLNWVDFSVRKLMTNSNNTGNILTDELKAMFTRDIIPLTCTSENAEITASAEERKIKFVIPAPCTIVDIFAELNTNTVGSDFTIDIKKNGVSIFTDLLVIDSGTSSSRVSLTNYVLVDENLSFVLGDYIEVFVMSVGSLESGTGLKIYLVTNKQ